MNPEDFKAGRHALGFSVSECAAAFGVDARTIRRWEDGTRTVPGTAEKLLEHLLSDRRKE
jgi:DNA-binding transcriptional regulator YiaG